MAKTAYEQKVQNVLASIAAAMAAAYALINGT